jgi:hypothetical protein
MNTRADGGSDSTIREPRGSAAAAHTGMMRRAIRKAGTTGPGRHLKFSSPKGKILVIRVSLNPQLLYKFSFAGAKG